ncbi:hypothetical protein NXS19_012499 [Fusarium pseudograminearum]|nr:hypothetical protein NXS19_012499 [Fusarium pseudograminearum]
MGSAVSEYLFTGKENTTDTCASSDSEAILGTLQRRDTRYFGLMDDRCYKSDTCEAKSDNSCRLGYKKVGFEVCGYWTSKGKAICCEETIAPKTCTWRGSGGDCNGQCHTGEVRLFQSKRGGGFKTESSNYGCDRGWKAFCCEEEEYDELLSGCKWTGCGGKCSEDENSVAYSTQFPRHCSILWFGTHLCCPKSKPEPLIDCHWVGQGDCAENSCANYEVTVGTEGYGGDKDSCAWGRRKALCCQHNPKAITCSRGLCEIDKSYDCGPDKFADWSEASGGLEERGRTSSGRRKLSRKFTMGKNYYFANVTARGYPGSTVLHSSTRVSRNDLTKKQIEASVDTDHNPDLQYATALLETAMTGILPNGTQMVTQAIDYKDIYDYWSKDVLPKLPSAGNRLPFLLLDRNLNQVKGRIFSDGATVQDPSLFAKLLKATIKGGNGHDGILDPIKWTISVFRYLNRAEVREQIQKNRQGLLAASSQISGAVPRLKRLHEIHQEFDYNWYRARTDNARKWVIGQLDLIENAFQKASPVPANYKTVMDTVAEFKTEARLIKPPPEDPKKYH